MNLMVEHSEPSELSGLLARAQEIEASSGHVLRDRPDLAELVTAAEEAGLSREAVIAALRERLKEEAIEHQPGELVFAQSPDGHWYPATFLGHVAGKVDLRYLNGGTGTVEATQIRVFSLAPGLKVQCYSNTYKTWTDAEIVRFNPDSKSVTTNYWYTEDVLPLERIRLKKETKEFKLAGKTRMIATTVAIALASGGLGALITFLATR